MVGFEQVMYNFNEGDGTQSVAIVKQPPTETELEIAVELLMASSTATPGLVVVYHVLSYTAH